MKENKYDNEVFFKKYSQMPRSAEGLESAGEWNTLKRMLPEFKGKRVLDLGCGFGWHCQYAMENGASSAVGIDLSEKMLDVANEKNTFENVTYLCSAIEDVDFSLNSFDIVISSLALHYVESFEGIVKNVRKMLSVNGDFVFSAEHPVFTAYGTQDWYYDDEGKILHFPVDNYFHEGKRNAIFLGENVVKYHKTLTTYLNTLVQNGFELLGIEEPQPSADMIREIPGMADEMRRPMMLIVHARKS